MSWLFNAVYCLLIAVASPWFLAARIRHGKYRDGWAVKLWGRIPPLSSSRSTFWFHAVSVGEVNALATILKPMRAAFPEHQFFITSTTRTGFELASKKFAQDTVGYAPLDFSWAVGRVLRTIRPEMIVLIELELWPNLLSAAKRAGIPVAIVNGRLSESSHRGYRRVRSLLSNAFDSIDLVAVQNQEYAKRFRDLGLPEERVVVTGSVKFDGANADRNNPLTKTLVDSAMIGTDDIIFLAGSTQRGEEAAAIDAFNSLAAEHPDLRLILVPRHPERFDEVAGLLNEQPMAWMRRSQLADASDDQLQSWRVLLVDSVGELGGWWGTSRFAFVGGSLGSRGGQNMIEPAAYGAAVSFGPNTRNFRDVTEMLLQHQAAVVVQDDAGLRQFILEGLSDPQGAYAMGERARRLVEQQRGATDRTIALLRHLVSDDQHTPYRIDAPHSLAVPIRRSGAFSAENQA